MAVTGSPAGRGDYITTLLGDRAFSIDLPIRAKHSLGIRLSLYADTACATVFFPLKFKYFSPPTHRTKCQVLFSDQLLILCHLSPVKPELNDVAISPLKIVLGNHGFQSARQEPVYSLSVTVSCL